MRELTHFVVHLCYFRFKGNPNPHWTAREWDTEVCLAPSSPWWRLRARGVCTVDWWQDCTDRWALPQSASACMTPWSSSTPGGQNVCDKMFFCRQWSSGETEICSIVIAVFIFHRSLYSSVVFQQQIETRNIVWVIHQIITRAATIPIIFNID